VNQSIGIWNESTEFKYLQLCNVGYGLFQNMFVYRLTFFLHLFIRMYERVNPSVHITILLTSSKKSPIVVLSEYCLW